ncbi:hypothetical protein [Caballeronia terrestris]|uniref:hypothetical protein n=1 Tax=Caballeronia terrestris TaxID=1226301 RepID=UPI000F749AB6|nr:hypothetical protein [Caballeronia terrestris]
MNRGIFKALSTLTVDEAFSCSVRLDLGEPPSRAVGGEQGGRHTYAYGTASHNLNVDNVKQDVRFAADGE